MTMHAPSLSSIAADLAVHLASVEAAHQGPPTLLSRLHEERAAESTWRSAVRGGYLEGQRHQRLYLGTVHRWAEVLGVDLGLLLAGEALQAGAPLVSYNQLQATARRVLIAVRARSGHLSVPLAEALGWNQSTLSRLEASDKPINVYRLHQLLATIGWSPSTFWAQVFALATSVGGTHGTGEDGTPESAGRGLESPSSRADHGGVAKG